MHYLSVGFQSLPRMIMAHRFAPANDYDTGFRSINWLELVYVEQGDWTLEVKDYGRFTAHPGDYFVCVPNLQGRCQTKPGGKSCISCSIALLGDFEYQILSEADFSDFKYGNSPSGPMFTGANCFVLPFHRTPDSAMNLEERFNTVIKEFNQPRFCQQYVLNGHALLLMAELTNELLQHEGCREAHANPPGNYLHARKIVEYLNNHYAAQLDLKALAGYMGLHPNYICNIFRKTTHQTLTGCLNRIRIEKAKQLLMNTRQTICSISSQVGIENEQYFGKLFKRMEGITPKQYRYFRNRYPE